jgi:hypothetical protein
MVQWAADVVRIRTTHDGSGRACGIVTGMGATAEAALAALGRQADALAQLEGKRAAQAAEAAEAAEEAAREAAYARFLETRNEEMLSHGGARPVTQSEIRYRQQQEAARGKPREDGPRRWQFEVVDVRLAPAPAEGGGGWLAYGTLAWEVSRQQASTTGRGSSGGDNRDRGGRDSRETH